MSAATNKVEAIVSRYCQEFPEQVSALTNHIEETSRSDGDSYALIRDLRSELHRMGGAAHCMGFRQVGEELNDIEHELRALHTRDVPVILRTLPEIASRIHSLHHYLTVMSPQKSKLVQRTTVSEQMTVGTLVSQRDVAQEDSRRRMMSKEKILFAEDDPYVREMIQSTLLDMGAGELHVAASGYEVLKVLNDFEPTVIITDWHMEPVSGLELLRCIRRGGTGLPADTPVIFFTSQKDTESTMTANRNGVNMVIGKPVLPSALRDNVLKVVEKKYHVKRRPRSMN